MPLRILFIGDIVGKPGRVILARALPGLIDQLKLHLVIANAENAAGGSGLNDQCYREITDAGVDVLTMGDHVYKKKDIMPLLAQHRNILRPANFPPEAPGSEFTVVRAKDGTEVAVFTVLGRIFMRPVDCPFRAADRVIRAIGDQARVIIVDMHAEATSDKQIMGRYLAGRTSAVLGTHTHVQTADEQILPGGTAYLTDVGMTGPYDSILGRRVDRVSETTVTFVPTFFDVATGDPRLCGALVDIDRDSGRALAIERIAIREEQAREIEEKAAISARNSAEPDGTFDLNQP
jgi:metallophosphoesterase (TIGR00282 family)